MASSDVLKRPGRSRRLLARTVAPLMGLSLLACGDHVGAAASIAGVTITESSVTEASGKLVAGQQQQPANGDLQFLNRTVLTAQIRHQLVGKVAAAQGVTVSDADFNGAMAAGVDALAQQLNVPADRVPETVRDTLTVLALAQKTTGKPVTDVSVTIDILNSFDTRDAAVAAREKYLAQPAAMDAPLQAAQVSKQGGSRLASLLKAPQLGSYGLFTEPSGSIVLIQSGGKYALARIRDRTVTQSDQLVASMREAGQQQGGQASVFTLAWLALQPFVANTGVSVNPRFGSWDPVTLQVVPSDAGL